MLLQDVSRCCIMGGTGTATRKPRNPHIFTLMIKSYPLSATVRHWRYDSRRAARVGVRRQAVQVLAALEWRELAELETAIMEAIK